MGEGRPSSRFGAEEIFGRQTNRGPDKHTGRRKRAAVGSMQVSSWGLLRGGLTLSRNATLASCACVPILLSRSSKVRVSFLLTIPTHDEVSDCSRIV